uniref:Uncharacterized protein n=1 Tax=Aegilops tauschii subsp. strangulata TaxID=200361 RepID=A0A453AH74_AEGTS
MHHRIVISVREIRDFFPGKIIGHTNNTQVASIIFSRRPRNTKKPRTGQQKRLHQRPCTQLSPLVLQKAVRPPPLRLLLLCPLDRGGGLGRALVASSPAAVLLTSVVPCF